MSSYSLFIFLNSHAPTLARGIFVEVGPRQPTCAIRTLNSQAFTRDPYRRYLHPRVTAVFLKYWFYVWVLYVFVGGCTYPMTIHYGLLYGYLGSKPMWFNLSLPNHLSSCLDYFKPLFSFHSLKGLKKFLNHGRCHMSLSQIHRSESPSINTLFKRMVSHLKSKYHAWPAIINYYCLIISI